MQYQFLHLLLLFKGLQGLKGIKYIVNDQNKVVLLRDIKQFQLYLTAIK